MSTAVPPHSPRKLRKTPRSTADPRSVPSPTPKGPSEPQPKGSSLGSPGKLQKEESGSSPRPESLPSSSQRSTEQAKESAPKAAKETAGQAEGPTEQAKGRVSQTAKGIAGQAKGSASEAGQGAVDQAKGATDQAKDSAPEAGQGAVDQAKGATDQAKGSAPEAGQGAVDQAKGSASEAGQGAVDQAKGSASEAGQGAIDQAKGATDQAKDSAPEAGQGAVDQAKGATDQAKGTADQAKGKVNELADLNGLPISDGGIIKDQAGQEIGKVTEGDPQDLVGYAANEKGEILDDDGDLIGVVEPIAGEAPASAQDTAKEGAPNDLAENAMPGLADLKGLPVGDNGIIKDKTGREIGKVTEGDPQDLVGYAANEKGEILDDDGDLIGVVTTIAGEAPAGAQDATKEEAPNDLAENAMLNLADLKGLPVGDNGIIKDKTGREVGKVTEGDPQDLVGYAANEKGEILDDDGDLIGVVEPVAGPDAAKSADEVEETAEGGEEGLPDLPPLSVLEGLCCNKLGKIIGAEGYPVGELVDGDARKITRLGATLDDKGQFWDNRGNIIGKAQTIPIQGHEEEPPFAGLEGLHVAEDGWVENDSGSRVGKIIEGDPKKVLGRYVDEDGEVTDKYGNVLARAEYYNEPEQPEPEAPDTSQLNGLTCTKTGFVIGPDGVPIARVVEGNPKELAGMKIDDSQFWDGRTPVGRVELIPEEEREEKLEGPFAGLEDLTVNKDGFVEDGNGNIVGQVTEGDIKNLRGRAVDEDGDILDKFGNAKGHAEPYEEDVAEQDLSVLEGKVVNKSGNVVDAQGNVVGRVTQFNEGLVGRKVDRLGQIWGDSGDIIGKAELIPDAEKHRAEGPFYGFSNAEVGKDGVVLANDRIIGRLVEGDPKSLLHRSVDEDGHILDKNGNMIGRAERWEPEEKPRMINPMAGRKVNREGEVRDNDGNMIGRVVSGNLGSLIGKEIDDNGYVVDNDGNRVGECNLIENIQEEEEEPGPSEEEAKAQQDREIAKKMSAIVGQTLDKVRPICQQIMNHIERAERTPKEELNEEELVKAVKPLLEEGGQILQECNGAIRGLDPDGHIAATAKARAASHEASPEENALADQLKELTETVHRTIEKGKNMIADMPHAKKELNPLWALLSSPLGQIIAAVGLLLSGVLGLVSNLLSGLGLGNLLNNLLGGLGLDKVLGELGL